MIIPSEQLQALITEHLQEFYHRRMQRLGTLKLKDILRRKNPYLYKAIGTHDATEIVRQILSAYLSSSDEGIFGDAFFEPLAKAVSGGVISPSEGVDIAIESDHRYLAIAVKSGPNIFSASQKKRQHDEFMRLRSRLMKLKKQFDAMVGHCYGKVQTKPSDNKIYRDSSGQAFWEELTGDADFYKNIIKLMRDDVIAKHREEYIAAWDKAFNKYIREFTIDFCDAEGAIDWEKLLWFNSGKPGEAE